MKNDFLKFFFKLFICFTLFCNILNINIIGSSQNEKEMNNIYEQSRDMSPTSSRSDNDLANSPWPMFGHDLTHTGRSPYNTARNNGIKKWSFKTDNAIQSSPVIDIDGTIYIGSIDHKLYALYPNGTMKWTFSTNLGIMSSPAIASDGTIYIASNDPKLYAINQDGTKKWEFLTDADVKIYSSIAIGPDGTIYFGYSHGFYNPDGKLYAVYPNGNLKWNISPGPGGYSAPVVSSDGTIFFSSSNGKLYSIYSNGTKKWDSKILNMSYSSPAIGQDGTIYVGSRVDTYDGPADLYPDGIQYAIYPNGTKKWSCHITGGSHSSPAIGPDGTFYIGYGDITYNYGKLYSFYLNGTKKWAFDTGSSVMSSPSVGSDGTIYVGSGYPTFSVYAVYPNGTKKWNFRTGGVVISSPAIDSNGTIYIGSDDNNVYAIGTTPVLSNPSAPHELRAIGENKKVNLFWNAPYDDGGLSIINYSIYKGTISGTEKLFTKIGDITTYEDSDVVNGITYYYQITANNTLGESAKSNEASAIPGKIPSAPYNLTASPSNSQITLTWNAPYDDGGLNIIGYSIYKGTISGTEKLFTKTGDITTYEDSDVVNGITYYYQITANNTLGESAKSNEAIAISGEIPSAPYNLTASPSNSQITLTWNAPIDNGGFLKLNYKVYRNGICIKILENVFEYVDMGLINGMNYSYNISALNKIGEGPKSNGVWATPRTVPSAPRDLKVTYQKAQLFLTWLVPDDNGGAQIMNYSIYRGTKSGCETLLIKGYSGGTSWIDTNIIIDSKYFYIVSAVNVAGEGIRSNEGNAMSGLPPGLPKGLSAIGSNSQIHLKWSVPKTGGRPNHYNIYRADSQIGNYTLIASTNTTEYKDTGLKNGKNYWYKINAENALGLSGNTTAVSASPYTTTNLTICPLLLTFIIIIILILIFTEIKRLPKKKGLS
jgi:outer membrane protein assembly factor BamB/fibronectin type 3 domain-containing protein